MVELDLLAHASRMDEMELVAAMDELAEGGILRSQSPQSYHFSHDKLHEVAYESLGVARLRLLHRRVATALLALHGSTVDTVSDQIATHLERGGLPEQAARHYLRAARAATRL
ncbi:MAG: SARP family transcriptional regulator, partial [Chloroflexota bacterium]|nr:SARP family transcriptional regulator [Chloroflexota bacterium]